MGQLHNTNKYVVCKGRVPDPKRLDSEPDPDHYDSDPDSDPNFY